MTEDPNHLHSNPRSLERQFISREFWSIREAQYQPLLPHDLSHHGTEIRRDARLLIPRGQIDQHTSCYPATRSPLQSWRFTLIIRIFLCPLVPSQTKASKKLSPTSLSRFFPTGSDKRKSRVIFSGQNLTIAGWVHVSRHSQIFATTETLHTTEVSPYGSDALSHPGASPFRDSKFVIIK